MSDIGWLDQVGLVTLPGGPGPGPAAGRSGFRDVTPQRPVVTPSARTKKAGQQLCGAEGFGQLIQTWLQAAALVMAAGMVMPG